jgi:hypothetical protein
MNYEPSNINYTYRLSQELASDLVTNKDFYISNPEKVAEIIQKEPFFAFVFFCDDYCYKYNYDYHYYKKMEATAFFDYIYLALKEANLDSRLYDNKDFFLSVCNHFKRNRLVTEPFYDHYCLSLENGVLDLETNGFYSHSISIRASAYATYRYDPEATCPEFMYFFNMFCSENKEIILYLRAWLYAAFLKRPYCPCLILQGSKDTQTLFVDVIEALTGFGHSEGSVLLINDHDAFVDIMEFSFESNPPYNSYLIITEKEPLPFKEKWEANGYKVLCLKTNKINIQVSSYLTFDQDNTRWLGPLALELPGILNFVLNMQDEDAIEILKGNGPSFSNKEDNFNILTVNLLQWVKEEICPGDGVYLGFQNNDNENIELLFPAFNKWCLTHNKEIKNINHKLFTKELLFCLKSQGFDVQKKKKNKRYFYN